MILIAMAGLPGTGKSTIARRLAAELRAPLLDKDRVRAALFGSLAVDYTREQDDLCCRAMYAAAAYIARRGEHARALIDGRTFTRRAQVGELVALARSTSAELRLIECRCSATTARARIERDAREQAHPAANRDWELYSRLASEAEPIEIERLVLDTEALDLDALVARALAFVHGTNSP